MRTENWLLDSATQRPLLILDKSNFDVGEVESLVARELRETLETTNMNNSS